MDTRVVPHEHTFQDLNNLMKEPDEGIKRY